jgi:PAS domain S-box-containing protein
MIGESIWTIGYLFELSSPTYTGKIIWDNIQFIGTDLVAIGIPLFTLLYTRRTTWVRRLLPALLIVPLINTILVWTNPVHHLVRTTSQITTVEQFPVLEYGYGHWMWVAILYWYLIIFAGIVILIIFMLRSHQQYYLPIIFAILGIATPVIGTMISATEFVTFWGIPKLDIAPFTFALANPFWAWGMFRHRLLDVVPIARDTLIEHIPDGILVLDLHHRIVDINPGAQTLLNRPAATVIGSPIEALLPVKDHDCFHANYSYTKEIDLPAIADGHDTDTSAASRRIECSVTPVYGKLHKHMLGWLVIMRDRTAQHQIEIALREREGVLFRAQRLAKLGDITHDVATNEIVWSQNLCYILGMGDTPHTLTVEEMYKKVYPEDLPLLQTAYEQVVQRHIPRADVEFRVFHTDGTIIYIHNQFEAIFDADGQAISTFGTAQDITERKLIENDLRVKQAHLQAIFNSAAMGIVIGDLQGNYTFINRIAAETLGYTPEEIYLKKSWELVHPADRQKTQEDLLNVIHGHIPAYQSERRYVCKDGRVIWAFISVSPIHNDQGEVEALLGVLNDITERKALEENLQRAREHAEAANYAKSAFLANMSHEFRTPLNIILGFTQILSYHDLTAEQQENLATIRRSGEHLLMLINDVLDMSKIEAGQIMLQEGVCHLCKMLSDLERMFLLLAREKGLSFEVNYPATIPRRIATDEQKLRQICMNILANAIKFTQTGGVSLRVWSSSVEQDQQQPNQPSNTESSPCPKPQIRLHFAIEDTGIGISSDDLEMIFEPFMQTETGQQMQGGTGLGLAISRKFIQLMGGDISVQSTLGQGTCFFFTLVVGIIASDEIAEEAEYQQIIGLAPDQPTYRILVVDDRLDNRRLLKEILTPVGFAVREACNGQEAIAVWQEWSPDFIWMDIRMPIMNGYEAASRIKALAQEAAPPIIALTTTPIEDQVQEHDGSVHRGCDDIMYKPLLAQELFEVMEIYLGVRYIYAEQQPHPLAQDPPPLLTPEIVVTLPHDWVHKMIYAATLGDVSVMTSLIDELKPTHPAAATVIQPLVENFQFHELVMLLEAKG